MDEALAALGEQLNQVTTRLDTFQGFQNRLADLERAMVELNRKAVATSTQLEDMRAELEKSKRMPDASAKTP